MTKISKSVKILFKKSQLEKDKDKMHSAVKQWNITKQQEKLDRIKADEYGCNLTTPFRNMYEEILEKEGLTEESTLASYILKEIQSLQELDNKTMGSYFDKADKQLTPLVKAKNAGETKVGKSFSSPEKKIKNRMAGTQLSAHKMVKKDIKAKYGKTEK